MTNSAVEKGNEFVRKHSLPFIVQKFLGVGSSSSVWLAQDQRDGILKCLKIVEKNEDVEAISGPYEKEAWLSMNHPNIIKLYEVIEKEDASVYVCEYLEGAQDLLNIMQTEDKPMSEERARNIFKQIVEAVEYSHQVGWAHRDIKLENILVSGDTPKLIDFGLATKSKTKRTKTFFGSPAYWSPEIFLMTPYDPKKADVWALGVLLHVLLTWEFPFNSDDKDVMKERIIKGDHQLDSRKELSADARDLLKRMLRVDSEKRLKISSIKKLSWWNDGKKVGSLLVTRKRSSFVDLMAAVGPKFVPKGRRQIKSVTLDSLPTFLT